MQSRVIIKIILFVMFFSLSNSFSFPLRNVEIGSYFGYNKFISIFNNYQDAFSAKSKKAIIIWRYSKANSVKIFMEFSKVCIDKSIHCISIELDNVDREIIINMINNSKLDKIFLLKDNDNIISYLGIYTLPVVIFIDEENRIIDAVGYEGQFYDKMSRYIDYIAGNISKEEYEKPEKNDDVLRKVSILPKINFWNKILDSGKKEYVIKEIESVLKDNNSSLDDLEYKKIAEIYIKLNLYDKAIEILDKVNQSDVGAKYLKSYILYKLNRYAEAIDKLKKIEDIYPDKKNLHLLFAKIYYKLGDYKNSAEHYEKAIDF